MSQRKVVDLTDDEPPPTLGRGARSYQRVCNNEPKHRVLFSYPPDEADNISLTVGDVATLEEGQFLNDQIIDFYAKLLQKRMSDSEKRRIHIFSSFFWRKLLDVRLPNTRFAYSLDKHAMRIAVLYMHVFI
jgi:hypothetical protein